MIFQTRKVVSFTPAAATKFDVSISASRPFLDVSGVREYPPMYNDLTDIWLRYRVTKVKVQATYYPIGVTEPMFGALFPYRAAVTGLTNVEELYSIPQSTIKALPNEYSKPVTITKVFELKDLYTLLIDGTEDGQESPLVWYNSTHQWNKIPNYEVFINAGIWSFGNTPRTIGGNITLDVQWYTELTGLNVFPLTTVKSLSRQSEPFSLDDTFVQK